MISKMFLRGDSVIMVLRNPLAPPPAAVAAGAAAAEKKPDVADAGKSDKKRDRDD